MAQVTFTPEAAKRIAAVVRKVERTPQDLTGERAGSYDGEQTFKAMILGADLSGLYTFNRVSPDPDRIRPAAFYVDGNPIRWGFEGETFVDAAREASGNRDVEPGTVVDMTLMGYDTAGKPA